MRCRCFVLAVFVVGVATVSDLAAEDSRPAIDVLRTAITKSIPLLEKGMAGSADQRKCFTCHNQAVPVLALAEAGKRGFDIEKENLKRQIQHTADHLTRGRKKYLKGSGQGGKVLTAGYALWTLEAGGWKADDTTAAVTEFLLDYQKKADHWSHPGKRPPSSGSDFTTTFVALRGLSAFGTKKQKAQIDARNKTIRQWLLSKSPSDSESRVFRLRALAQVNADKQKIQHAAKQLIDSQRDDGGWAQTADMKSDAYATATVLVALLRTKRLPADAPAVNRGLRFLIDTQRDDGSWRVVTRAKPFQTYFETGFPHGKDQFISITASSWATLALLLTLPESP